MGKIRPAIIRGINYNDNKIVVQKITTKRYKNQAKIDLPFLKRKSYLSKDITKIEDYKLVRFLGKIRSDENEYFNK